MASVQIARRRFVQAASIAAAGMTLPGCSVPGRSAATPALPPLAQFDYGDVELPSEAHEKQLERTLNVLMGLSDDSMLKPLREMSGLPAPGEDLGRWHHYAPCYLTGGYVFSPRYTFF